MNNGPSCSSVVYGSKLDTVISISLTYPFKITAKSDFVFGYKREDFCLECSIDGQTILSKEIKVIQETKCKF